ncbi:MAG: LysM domain-containing protein [Planctomycetota bacterium]|nr:LysM domain-containing protein [Planctomycetota bacterium]
MGNFEKLVVLTVLFLAATILGITMHGDGEVRSDDPLGTGAEGTGTLSSLVTDADSEALQPKTEQRQKPKAEPVIELPKAPVTEPAAEPVVEQAPVKPQPKQPELFEAEGKLTILKTTAGLQEAYQGAHLLSYVWKDGDSLSSLAEFYYGDRKLRTHLRAANEGHEQPLAGEVIWIPRFDELAEAGSRPTKDAAPVHKAPIEAPAGSSTATTYTVVEGDSLWNIASDAYGKGTRWSDIFKANRHQMKNENDLKIGMQLIIP